MYKRIFKRIFDVTISIIGAIILLPVFIFIVVCSFLVYKGHVFYLQKRIGYKHQIFTIYKFRTMLDLKGKNDQLLPDVFRVNYYGYILRKYSLDEIPQIFNILKGDLSIVGPRPLLVEYLDYFTLTELVRHSIKPGITGLAQTSGRNSIKWSKRLEYDVYYVQNHTLFLDLKILIKTFAQVFKGQSVHLSTSFIEERKRKVNTVLTTSYN